MKFKIPFIGKGVEVRMNDVEYGADGARKKVVKEAIDQIQSFKKGRERIEAKLIENEQWYKSRHWEYIRNDKFSGDPEPVMPELFSALLNKHSDAMDFYPSANALPREADDESEAEKLSQILPVEFEYNDFRSTWDKGWWEKLKHGCQIFAVLFDPDGGEGIGSGKITLVDALNIIFQPGINDIEESAAVYTYRILTREQFADEYPDADPNKAEKVFEPKKYITDDSVDYTNCIIVFDRYYKKRNSQGKKTLQFMQFAGEEMLFWSEEDEDDLENGYYHNNRYPFYFDVLFPEKNNILGFGLIDIAKNPQIYIDKLDQLIMRNAFTTGRKRYLISEAMQINTEEFKDVSNDIIHFAGNLDDSKFRELSTDSIAADISNHRKQKIDELEKVTATNEFSRGESSAGVTAASAIIALQKASGKVSRDMIQASYNTFAKVVYHYVDIIRQFYSAPRPYRVEDSEGNTSFASYSNEGLTSKPLPMVSGMEQAYRKPVFDIKIIPEKQDPFSQAAHNEMGKEMFQIGMFNPEAYLASSVALEMMQFDGKDKVVQMMEQNAGIKQQLMMLQQLQVQNQKLMSIVQKLTGEDLGIREGANGTGQNNQM